MLAKPSFTGCLMCLNAWLKAPSDFAWMPTAVKKDMPALAVLSVQSWKSRLQESDHEFSMRIVAGVFRARRLWSLLCVVNAAIVSCLC